MPTVSIPHLAPVPLVNGATLWHYKAGDHSRADVLSSAYWNPMAPNHRLDAGSINVGDWILVAGFSWALNLCVIAADQQGIVVIEPANCS